MESASVLPKISLLNLAAGVGEAWERGRPHPGAACAPCCH